jgi:class 3 adenylate cyclase
MTIPDTQYAKSGDVNIAYQVGGEGPFELVLIGGLDAPTIGARVAAEAEPGEVLVSGTVRDLVAGSGITFDTRGTRNLKGLGEWPLFAVSAA